MKPVLKLVRSAPSNDEVARYYFSTEEALEILKCGESTLRALLDEQDFGQVLVNGKWYLPPDLSVIRAALWGGE